MPGREDALPVDLESAIERLPDVFLTLDDQWRVTYLNGAAARFLARDAPDVLGREFWKELPELTGTAFEAQARYAMREGHDTTFEVYDASRAAWLEVHVLAQQGGLAVHLRDVTARKRSEERQSCLQRVAARLQDSVQGRDVAQVLLSDGLTGARAASGRVYALREDGQLELLGSSGALHAAPGEVSAAFHQDSAPAMEVLRRREAVFVSADQGRSAGLHPERGQLAVLPMLAADRPLGVLIFTFERADPLVPAERAYLSGLAQLGAFALERAELKHAEFSRRAQLDALLAYLPVGVVLAEAPSGRVVLHNAPVAQWLGASFPRDADDHANWHGYRPNGQVIATHERPLVRAARHGEVIDGEVVVYDAPGGERRLLRVSASPVRDAHGVIHSAVAVFEDITARQRDEQQQREWSAMLERRVEERTRQLRLANEELDAFSYSVSHDLRTPLRHIRGFTHLLTRALGAQPPPGAAQYLQRIERAAEQMDALVESLLAFAHLGQQPISAQNVPLRELAESVREELALDYLHRRVQWRIAQLPVVRGDPDLLRQVLVNLFSNALKYTRTREVAHIEVDAAPLAGEWVVYVRDNGVGFDARYAQKLFGVFQRLHVSDEFEGVGVGLANVRRIILRHGGRVWAEGVKGEGATFAFTLPMLSVEQRGE